MYVRDILRSMLPPFRRTAVPTFLRRIAGMPDYSAYAEHSRRWHPDQPLLTPQQFYQEFVEARYADGPTRCC
jgi:uncharacterized short protein YbdD (DUF466 family)